MAKVKINSLPPGLTIKNGKIVNMMQQGGVTTGDQFDFGLVTTVKDPNKENASRDINVRHTLNAVPRNEANIEAEGGETVLTDLDNDGLFGLYEIKGPRHSSGGVPLNLPEQSFVFSDTKEMKLGGSDLKAFGIKSRKKMTPADISKKYELNPYYGAIKDQYADDFQVRSAELMMDKNKKALSKLAFVQESKKDFEEGVPVTAYPYLLSQGIDPIDFTAKVEKISMEKAQQKAIDSLPPNQRAQLMMLQQIMEQAFQQQMEAPMQEEMPMAQVGRELPKAQVDFRDFNDYYSVINPASSFPLNLNPVNFDGNVRMKAQPNNENDWYNFIDLTTPLGNAISIPPQPNEQEINWPNLIGFTQPMGESSYYGPSGDFYGSVISEEIPADKQPAATKRRFNTPTSAYTPPENLSKEDAYKTAIDLYNKAEKTKSYEDVLAFQKFFHKYYPDKAKKVLKNYDVTRYGKSKNLTADDLKSNEEGLWGKRTQQYRASLNSSKTSEQAQTDQTINQEDQPTDRKTITPGTLGKTAPSTSPEFWLQDLLQLNAIAARDRDMFFPFQPAVSNVDLGYVLEDPTRAIAAINEQLGLQTQAAGAFGGPQALAARTAQAQAQAANAIANEVARVNQRNVGTINQGLARQAQVNAALDAERRNRTVKEYDDIQAVLQKHMDEKNFDREQYAQFLSNALTNRANTYNLNTLQDYFQIDPSSGGMIGQFSGKAFEPTPLPDPNASIKQYAEMARLLKAAGINPTAELIQGIMNQNVTTPQESNAMRAYKNIPPGYGASYYPATTQQKSKKGKEVEEAFVPFYVGRIGG